MYPSVLYIESVISERQATIERDLAAAALMREPMESVRPTRTATTAVTTASAPTSTTEARWKRAPAHTGTISLPHRARCAERDAAGKEVA